MAETQRASNAPKTQSIAYFLFRPLQQVQYYKQHKPGRDWLPVLVLGMEDPRPDNDKHTKQVYGLIAFHLCICSFGARHCPALQPAARSVWSMGEGVSGAHIDTFNVNQFAVNITSIDGRQNSREFQLQLCCQTTFNIKLAYQFLYLTILDFMKMLVAFMVQA